MELADKLDSLDGVDESMRPLYAKGDDGTYQLNLRGIVSKDKLAEFRDNNVKFMKEKEQLSEQLRRFKDAGVDLDEWQEWQSTKRKMQEKELLAKGDVDAITEQRLESFRKDWSKKEGAFKAQIEAQEKELRQLLIDSEIRSAAQRYGVIPDQMPFILADAHQKFAIVDGKAVAQGSDGSRLTDGDLNELTPDSYVKTLPKSCFQASTGGGARPGNGAGGDNSAHHRGKMTPKQKADFIHEHGGDAYMKLPV